ncbi:MAG: hypothetical protein R2991_08805 [Thermoanaerobaculia bacterium]
MTTTSFITCSGPLLLLFALSGGAVRATAPADLLRASIDAAGNLVVEPSVTSSREDLDFLAGRWRLEERRRDGAAWRESEATAQAKEIIDGFGALETVKNGEADPAERITMALFDAETRLWGLYGADSATATLDWRHPLLGSFEAGVGTFYSRQTLDGGPALVRLVWDASSSDRTLRRRAVSRDDGATWEEVESIAAVRDPDGERRMHERLLTIDRDLPIPEIELDGRGELVLHPSATSSPHDFDFLYGNWSMEHLKLAERLSGSTTWNRLESMDWNYGPMLDGLGNSDLLTATFDGEHFEGFTLRLFDPETRLWSLYWVASNSGVLDPPVVGSFDGAVGHFFCKDTYKGQEVIVVFRWDMRDKEHPVWSQAFSPDQGKTWEWNWINVCYRVE